MNRRIELCFFKSAFLCVPVAGGTNKLIVYTNLIVKTLYRSCSGYIFLDRISNYSIAVKQDPFLVVTCISDSVSFF